MTTIVTNAQNILRDVDIVFQVMAKAAYRWDGLFPALTERHNGNLLTDWPLPAPIPGQRNSDRSPRGCNLSHDVGLLATLDGLDKALGRPRYQLQRENYLKTWAENCSDVSPTGLLPWGEHSYWNLELGTIGNSYLAMYNERALEAGLPTHHQLDILPLRDWKTLNTYNPRLLPRFVDGLDWHWDDDERTSFNRHAPITQFIRGYQVKRSARQSGKPVSEHSGSDFPGAAGVFIHDYACALALAETPEARWKDQLLAFSNSWWDRRRDDGLLDKSGGKSKLNWNGASLGQTVSHGACLLAAAEALRERDPDLAELLYTRGAAFVAALLAVDQPDIDAGHYGLDIDPDSNKPMKVTLPWAGNRGQSATAKALLQVLNAADAANNPAGIELVLRGARVYLDSDVPRDLMMRAGDPGAAIALVTECYRRTNESEWLDAALRLATQSLELYFDAPLPRAAIGRAYYESQQGSSVLVHALARLVLVAEGEACVGGLERPMY